MAYLSEAMGRLTKARPQIIDWKRPVSAGVSSRLLSCRNILVAFGNATGIDERLHAVRTDVRQYTWRHLSGNPGTPLKTFSRRDFVSNHIRAWFQV